MRVAVGSCGSSGSTFFRYVIDRHPKLVGAGPELSLYSKTILFDDYNYIKENLKKIKKHGVSNFPYNNERGILEKTHFLDLDEDKGWRWVKNSNNINELSKKIENHVLKLSKKDIWMEKTPRNIFNAKKFLEQIENGKFIHIVRDPRDVILSLQERGYDFIKACERWLASVAAIQNTRNHKNLLEISYENLVAKPEKTLKKVCNFLEVEFKMDYFETKEFITKKFKINDGKKSWNLDPSKGFSTKSVGKYKNKDMQIEKMGSIKLTKEYAELYGIKQYNIKELAEEYGYEFPDISKYKLKNKPININYKSLKTKFIAWRTDPGKFIPRANY